MSDAAPGDAPPTLLLAGCGKMGGAMLAGWLQRGVPSERVHIVEPNAELRSALESDYGVNAYGELADVAANLAPDVVLFAVKPQQMDDVVPPYARLVRPETVFLSIAAGKPAAYFEGHLGDEAAIVRAMPNTPAAVRRGITVGYPNANVSENQRALCDELLRAIGAVEWIDDESLMDAVTAVSGGGPAYVFLLAESLAAAGAKAGLPEALATRLARETVAGAGELLYQSPEDPAKLRENVTSPGGTTAEALAVLMGEDGWQQALDRAIAAAAARSRELAG